MIRKMTGALALAAIIACFVTACNSVPVTDQEKSLFGDEVGSAIQRFHNIDPFIGRQMDSAWGYAVFPSVGRGGVGLGGAYGAGEVFEKGQPVGYCELKQGTIGAQLGGQEYRELILFQDAGALSRFKNNEFAFAAQANAVAAKEGTSTDADYKEGVIVYTEPIGGLMAEASVGGQKFSFRPLK